ncbi:thiamine pyrophosphate-binding protein [Paraburkholderia tropica]|uniref:thiamine pyrophosphate-binding protein n=1 Tax=Paraburkholderia tropica TaxID=92647 RepID=UPI00160B1705|nr:thiamine pyrophosphate-binding protein [Paraburkholderia tropica]MBB2983403.1 acetolactate synthase-1/2/3 large subunit [Paraburkholderia tropica]
MKRLSGDDFLAQSFRRYGVTHFFYVPVIVPMAVRAMTELGITPVMTHAEKAAAYMADGYARVSGRPGVCGSQTIGGTNLAAGLRDAFQSRNPVIALTGGKNRRTRYRLAYQEIEDTPIFKSLTKFTAVVEDAARFPDLLHTAFRAATAGMPSPVHLELGGFDGRVISDEIDVDMEFDSRYGQAPSMRTMADPAEVQRAAAALNAAKRPIIVAGGGVRASRAEAELRALARKQNIPVATSLNAKGVVTDDNALAAGVVGEYSRTCANKAVFEADLVLFIGSLTGGLTTRNWSVPRADVQVIHVDIEPENVGRNFPSTIGLCGDAKCVLSQLERAVEVRGADEAWLGRVRELRAEWAEAVRHQETSDAMPMRPERLCRDLSDVAPDDTIFVGDTGHAGAWMAQNIYARSDKQRFIRAHGSLGWSLPAAIGAKCAAPEQPVVCFTGDGGFFYHVAELETAVRYGINVVVVVNNNSSLNQEQVLWEGSDAWDKNWKFAPVDICGLARAFGCDAYKVEDPKDLKAVLENAFTAGKPVVIDAVTDIDACSMPAWGPPGTVSLYAVPGKA